jgi:predicted peptidase
MPLDCFIIGANTLIHVKWPHGFAGATLFSGQGADSKLSANS